MQFHFPRSMCSPIYIPIDERGTTRKGYELKGLPTATMYLLDFLLYSTWIVARGLKLSEYRQSICIEIFERIDSFYYKVVIFVCQYYTPTLYLSFWMFFVWFIYSYCPIPHIFVKHFLNEAFLIAHPKYRNDLVFHENHCYLEINTYTGIWVHWDEEMCTLVKCTTRNKCLNDLVLPIPT